MVKIITVLLFLLITFPIHAQDPALLTGKWVFKKALNKEVDAEGQNALNAEVVNKMTFEFKNDHKFIGFILEQNMTGKWALFRDSKMIILDTGKEKIDFKILKLTETDLILKLGLGEFLMKKHNTI